MRAVAHDERHSNARGRSEQRVPHRPPYMAADNSSSSNSSRGQNTEGTAQGTTGVPDAANCTATNQSKRTPQHKEQQKGANRLQRRRQQQQQRNKLPELHDQRQQQQARQQQQQRPEQLPSALYMQRLSQCNSWHDVQSFKPHRETKYFRAAAAAAARAVRRQALAAAAGNRSQLQKLQRRGPVYCLYLSDHRSASSGSSSSSSSRQRKQQQQEGEAQLLFRWYVFRVLGAALRTFAPDLGTAADAAAVGAGQDTAAAAAAEEVLIIAAHQPRTDPVLPQPLPPSQQQQQQHRQGLDHQLDPLTAAVLLQSAAAMGWNAGNVGYITGRGRDDLQKMLANTSSVLEAGLRSALTQQQQQQGNQIIIISSSKQHEISCHPAVIVNLVTAGFKLGINFKDQPGRLLLLQKVLAAALSSSSSRVGYPFCVKLLHAWVLLGMAMPPMVMEPLVACFKAHLEQRPRLLRSLLLQLYSLEQSKIWPSGKELLSRFRDMLFDSDITDRLLTHLHSQIQHHLSSSSSSSSSSSDGGCSGRVETLLQATAALTQLPKRTRSDLDPDLKVILIRSGIDDLIKATDKIVQGCDLKESRDLRYGSSWKMVQQQQQQQIMRSGFTPVQISKWLSDLSKVVGSDLAAADRRDLEVALLDYLGATTACHGIWPPTVFLPLATAAAALGLPAAAAAEWWAAVQDIVLLEIKQYSAVQALHVQQLMLQGKFRPEPKFSDLALLPAAAQGFCTAAAAGSSSSSSSSKKKVRKLTAGQLTDLLECLADLKIKPRNDWLLDYQESLLLQCKRLPQLQQQQQQQQNQQQQQQQEQEQQQPCLTASQVVKLIHSAGNARLHLQPDLLHFLLQQLKVTRNNNLTNLTAAECVDLFVGLSKVVRTPGVLHPLLYRRLCKILSKKWFLASNISNILSSMGRIATSTADGAVSAAAVAQETGSSSSSSSSRAEVSAAAGSGAWQQQQLLPPKAIVKHLLSNVTDYMDRLGSRALPMMLWGLRKIEFTPDDQWLARYQEAVAAVAQKMKAHELAITVSCLVHMGCTVDSFILDRLLSERGIETFSPGIMTDLAAALEMLGQQQQQQQQHVVPDQQRQRVAQMQSKWYDPDQQQQQQQGVSLHVDSNAEADRPATLDDLDLRSDQISRDLGSDHASDVDLDVDQLIDAARRDNVALKSVLNGSSSSSNDSDSEQQHVSLHTVPVAVDTTWEDMELEALNKPQRSADHDHLVRQDLADHGSDHDLDLDLDLLIDSAFSKRGSWEAILNASSLSESEEQEDPELAKQITERVTAYVQLIGMESDS